MFVSVAADQFESVNKTVVWNRAEESSLKNDDILIICYATSSI